MIICQLGGWTRLRGLPLSLELSKHFKVKDDINENKINSLKKYNDLNQGILHKN